MGTSLYIDSSHFLTIGLLDEKYDWISYKNLTNKKNAGILHGLVEETLSASGSSLFDLDRVFYSAGPGSYTGIRLIEGFCQILRWRGIETNSFYLFEVPSLLGIESGSWLSEAYKGELFHYSWDKENLNSSLIKKEEAQTCLKDQNYIVSHENIEGLKIQLIGDLINSRSQDLFSKVLEKNLEREPFYYRAIEQEFTKPKNIRGI